MRWFTSRFCDAPDETELTRSRRRRCNCRLYNHCAHSAHGSCSSWRAPTSVIAGIDFSFFTLWQARAIQPTSQGRLDPRLPWQPHDTHLYKNNSLFDRHKPVPFRSDKTLTFSDGAIKRIIDTCLFQPVSSDTVPPLRKMGAVVFLFRLQRNGRFPRRICILIKPAFCIGVSRRSFAVCYFVFVRYHTFGVLGRCALFLIITEAATYPSSR